MAPKGAGWRAELLGEGRRGCSAGSRMPAFPGRPAAGKAPTASNTHRRVALSGVSVSARQSPESNTEKRETHTLAEPVRRSLRAPGLMIVSKGTRAPRSHGHRPGPLGAQPPHPFRLACTATLLVICAAMSETSDPPDLSHGRQPKTLSPFLWVRYWGWPTGWSWFTVSREVAVKLGARLPHLRA